MKPLFQTKAILLAAVLLAGGITSCTKDKENPTPGGSDGKTCKVTEMNMTTQFGAFKTTFTYSSNGKLTETKSISPFGIEGSLYTYNSNGQVSTREQYDGAGKTIVFKTEYSYNATGVSELKKYFPDNGTLQLFEIHRYEYVANQISKVRVFSVANGQETETGYYAYVFDNNSNVKSIQGFEDDGNGGFEETYRRSLTYDGKATLWAITAMMGDDPNFPAHYNIASDKTEVFNVDTQSWETDEDLNYTYTYNAEGLPSTATVPGFGNGSFSYSCQ